MLLLVVLSSYKLEEQNIESAGLSQRGWDNKADNTAQASSTTMFFNVGSWVIIST